MKKYFCSLTVIIISLLINTADAQTWREVDMGESHYIYAVHFLNSNTGFWGGDSNLIKKTTDGGKSWQTKYKYTGTGNTYIRSIEFVNDNIGFCGGDKGLLLKTTDAGETWNQIIVSGFTGAMRNIKFISETEGYIAAQATSGYAIIRTIDGGDNWSTVYTTAGTIYQIEFAEGTTNGIAVGNATSNLFYTSDGITWTKSEMPVLGGYSYITANVTSVDVVNSQVAYACGSGNTLAQSPSILLKTTDGGKTWQFLEQNTANKITQTLYSIKFKDELNGIAVGGSTYSSSVTKTTDGGQTWNPVAVPFGGTLNVLTAVGDELWAGGYYSLIGYSSDFGTNWNVQVPGAYNTIYSIYKNGNKIILGSIAGLMFKSADNGVTWSSEFLNVGNACTSIQDIFFINDNIGYIARDGRQVCKTTDGGDTWFSILPDSNGTSVVTNTVFFVNENLGFAAGKVGLDLDAIYRTSDGGATWTITTNTLQGAVRSIIFANENNGIAVGENFKSAYTTDGGTTWNLSSFNSVPETHIGESNLTDVIFTDGLNAVAVGDSIILKSSDGGINWNYVPVDGMVQKLSAVDFSDAANGYALGNLSASPKYAYLYITEDGGNTWEGLMLDTNMVSPGVDTGELLFTEDGHFWITGGMTYTTSPLTDVTDNYEVPASFRLEQNYPNPFNPSTTISFSVDQRSMVSVKIYDIMGSEVACLYNKETAAGSYSVKFNAAAYASGVYFCRMQAGSKTKSIKMSLIK